VIVDGTQKAAPGRRVRPVTLAADTAGGPQETARLGATK